MHFTLDDLQQLTNLAAFKRGQAYFRQHKVLSAYLDQAHEQIVAEVQGNESYPYEVFLFWEDEELTSDCSCPVGYNCKHGVAAGLHWLQAQPQQAVFSPKKSQPAALSRQKPAAAKPATNTPDTSLSQWLSSLPSKEVEAAPEFSLQPSEHHLLYQLKQHQGQHELYMYKAYLKVNGQWSQHSQYFPAHYMGWNAPLYFRPEDEEILRQLDQPHTNNPVLAGTSGRKILDLLLLTQRLMHQDQRPLQTAPSRVLSWHWQPSEREQRLTAKLEDMKDWQVIAVTPPCYLDPVHATIGEIETTLTGSELAHLSTMPAVPNEQMAMTALQLRRVFTPQQLPLQAEPEFLREDTPIPHLTLTRAQGVNGQSLLGARINFDYGPISLPAISRVAPRLHGAAAPSALPLSLLQEHDGRTYLIERDEHAEQHYIQQLCELDLWQRTLLDTQADTQADKTQNFWAPASQDASMAAKQWQQLVEQGFPELKRQGWRVSEAPDYHFEIHDAEFELSVQDGYNGWFDLSLGLQQGENTFDTMEVMAAWFKADMPEQLLLPVDDDWLRLDMQPLWTIRDLLFELFEKSLLNHPVSLPAFQAVQLQHLDLEDRHAPLTRTMMAQLQDFSGLQPVAVPVGLNAELRPYQQQGLDWLVFLHRYGLGGILADDMGLGKTIQTLALILHLKETEQLQQPAMILAPTSLVGNWQHEAHRFAPDLKVLVIHGPQRHGSFAEIDNHDVVITTYPLLLRDSQQYAQQQFSVLVLDEAQAIKNPITKVAHAVRTLKAGLRLCLSGTPLENHLGELWALFDFVLPGLLSGRSRFNKSYRQPIENEGNRQRQQELGQRLAPFMLRRTKAEVVTELPAKTEIIQYVELQGKQRALYEGIRVSMEKRLRTLVAQKGMARSHIEFLDALLKLRQACIDPRLVKLEKAQDIKEHAKLDWLADAIPRMLEEGRNLLVFSQFTEVLGLIEADLKRQRIAYSKLTGRTRHRQAAIDSFQQGETRVFLISLKAGGSGLNLTAADVVIHVDPWWNPAVENQATDRAHRIGQDKPVFVYKLVATDTVEERIQQMQQQKQALADALFSDTSNAALPTDADGLLALLS